MIQKISGELRKMKLESETDQGKTNLVGTCFAFGGHWSEAVEGKCVENLGGRAVSLMSVHAYA